MLRTEEWVGLTNDRLDAFLQQRLPQLTALSEDLAPVASYAQQLLTGGKRFRAQFALLGANVVADEDIPPAMFDIAAGLEIFHAAALVHDDIMDKSDTRRGILAAHRQLEKHHEDSHWLGNAADFGTASALLLGDLLLAFSDELVSQGLSGNVTTSAGRAARAEFDRMRLDVTAGQYLDIVEEHAWPIVAAEDALPRAKKVVVYKSAKYSIEAPLVIGASFAGASTAQISSLRAAGIPMGVAFQLRDDLLGVFGDPEATGKPAGDDLREGKRTVLIALAQENLGASTIRLMNEMLGDPDLSDNQIETLRQTLLDSGAVDRVEEMVSEQSALAHRAIDELETHEDARLALHQLADKVSQRTT